MNKFCYCFKFLELYYFDPSGKSFSIPNGIQDYTEQKYYIFMIRTYAPMIEKISSVFYSVEVVLPSGQEPIVKLR